MSIGCANNYTPGAPDDITPVCSPYVANSVVGGICRQWANLGEVGDPKSGKAISNLQMGNWCSQTQHPDDPSCACILRNADPIFQRYNTAAKSVTGGNVACWYTPCTTTDLVGGNLVQSNIRDYNTADCPDVCGAIVNVDNTGLDQSGIDTEITCDMGDGGGDSGDGGDDGPVDPVDPVDPTTPADWWAAHGKQVLVGAALAGVAALGLAGAWAVYQSTPRKRPPPPPPPGA